MSTKIQWTDETINFWWGCTKVSPACQSCYAESIAKRLGNKLFGHPVKWGDGNPRGQRVIDGYREALALESKAAKQGGRRRVFINSMSDWLDDQIPLSWLEELLFCMANCRHLDFQLLTKRPQNWLPRIEAIAALRSDEKPAVLARNWLAGNPPPNVWIGCTAENQHWLDVRMIYLAQIPAAVRFLSCEPLLGPLNLHREACTHDGQFARHVRYLDAVQWVITGGESGQRARPSHPDWFRSLRDQCADAAVAFFFKQHGEWQEAPDIDTTTHLMHGHPAWDLVPASVTALAPNQTLMHRPGKAAAGNLVDGIQHLAFPTPTVTP